MNFYQSKVVNHINKKYFKVNISTVDTKHTIMKMDDDYIGIAHP